MSNRAARRRAEREQQRRRTISVPTNGRLVRADVLTPQGVSEVTNFRKLPAKRPGVHRWVAALSHYLTDEQAEAFDGRSDDSPVLLDSSSVMFVGLGCIDCEGEYREAAGSPCPAGDEWPES